MKNKLKNDFERTRRQSEMDNKKQNCSSQLGNTKSRDDLINVFMEFAKWKKMLGNEERDQSRMSYYEETREKVYFIILMKIS